METHERICSICSATDQVNHNIIYGKCGNCGYNYGIVIGNLRFELSKAKSVSGSTAVVLGATTINATTANIPATITYEGVAYNVIEVAANAFKNMATLTSVTLPSSVKKIGTYAFANSGIAVDALLANLTEIEEGAFQRCKSVGSFTIPATIMKLGEAVFAYCNFASNSITVNTATISRKMFLNSTIAEVNIGATVRTIGREAFAGCTKLVKVKIEIGVTDIDQGAFCSPNDTGLDTNFDYKGTKDQWNKINKYPGWHAQNTYYLTVYDSNGNSKYYKVTNGTEREN